MAHQSRESQRHEGMKTGAEIGLEGHSKGCVCVIYKQGALKSKRLSLLEQDPLFLSFAKHKY